MELQSHPVVIDSSSQNEASKEVSNLVHKKDKIKSAIAQFIDDKWKFTSKYEPENSDK